MLLVINITLLCSVPALIVNSEQNLIFISESSHSTYCSSYSDIAFICLEVVTIHVCYHGEVRFAIVFYAIRLWYCNQFFSVIVWSLKCVSTFPNTGIVENTTGSGVLCMNFDVLKYVVNNSLSFLLYIFWIEISLQN